VESDCAIYLQWDRHAWLEVAFKPRPLSLHSTLATSAATTSFNSQLRRGSGSRAKPGVGDSVLDVLLSSKQKDVGLRPVNGVVHPSSALLNTYLAPLVFRQESILRNELGNVGGQNNVT
jgi:hypothetical protein